MFTLIVKNTYPDQEQISVHHSNVCFTMRINYDIVVMTIINKNVDISSIEIVIVIIKLIFAYN